MSTNTREKVMRTLLTRPRITINELAENVGINPISVRHHISSLAAEGLVESEEERHGVGRDADGEAAEAALLRPPLDLGKQPAADAVSLMAHENAADARD